MDWPGESGPSGESIRRCSGVDRAGRKATGGGRQNAGAPRFGQLIFAVDVVVVDEDERI
jgi:hypothetical protein